MKILYICTFILLPFLGMAEETFKPTLPPSSPRAKLDENRQTSASSNIDSSPESISPETDNKVGFKQIPDKTTLPLLNPALQQQKVAKIELSNGLQAVIISDPLVKQSVATITVMAGSWQDPDEFPGLAHFLEHMLFLGTEDFPTESEFGRFLAEHGGKSNAFTHSEYTSYMFSINTPGYPEALQRFASFFKTPLFNPSGVNRELNAIDQEFAQGFNNDGKREYHVLKAVANLTHPAHRFQAGNSKTLAKASTDNLRQWFEKNYSSNLMRLYVLSPLPLDQLQELVVKNFSGIQNKNKNAQYSTGPLFSDEVLGKFLLIESRTDQQTLSLIWELPADIPQKLATKPDDLLCYVLGHEGKESLLAELKREGLAESLGCGSLDLGMNISLFEIQVSLTTKGLELVDTVIERVFQTLKLLQEKPFPEPIFHEYAEILQQRYQYQAREEPFDWAMKQASWLAREPIDTYPELSSTIRTLDQEDLKRVLKMLTPSKSLFVLAAPASKLKKTLDRKEPWMHIAYSVEPVSEEILKQWEQAPLHNEISLPTPNRFIATTLDAAPARHTRTEYPYLPIPKAIMEQEGIQIFYAPDPFYQIPRSFFRFQIQSPEIKDGSPRAMVFTDLYVKALQDQASVLLYEAKVADLNVTIERTYGALQITLEGFTESMLAFFPEFLTKLLLSPVTTEKFTEWKEALQREYENAAKDMPAKQTFDFFKGAVFDRYSTYPQKRQAIRKITEEGFQKFTTKLFKSTYLKGVLTGGLTEQQALNITSTLDKNFHTSKTSIASPYYATLNTLPPKGPYLLTESSRAQGDALLLVLEVDGFSPRLRNLQQLLSLALNEAFFSELRTKQQTGYIVASDALDLQKHLFEYFVVQSNTHVPHELLWRIEQFIEGYLLNIKTTQIPPERFKALKKTLAIILKDPPSSLQAFGEQQFKLAFDIEDFDWMKKRLDDLPKITYEDFLHFNMEFLGRSNKKRFAIMLEGLNKEEVFNYTPLKNMSAFRNFKG